MQNGGEYRLLVGAELDSQALGDDDPEPVGQPLALLGLALDDVPAAAAVQHRGRAAVVHHDVAAP